MPTIDPILMFIGGGFLGVIALMVISAKVLSSAPVAAFFANRPGLGPDDWVDSSTGERMAYSELNSFVPDVSDSCSSDDSSSDSPDSCDGGGSSSDD